MSLGKRLRRVQTNLAVGIVARAVAWALVGALSVAMLAIAADAHSPLSLSARYVVIALGIATFAAVTISLLWRDRYVWSLGRVALWLEEQQPSLEYRLVTAIETGLDGLLGDEASDRWTRLAGSRAMRSLGMPLAALIVAVVILVVLPAGAVARIRSPRRGDSLDRVGAGKSTDRLTPLVASIVPPPYVGLGTQTVDDPSDIRAIVGSVITLRGRGDSSGITGILGADSLHATSAGDRWSIRAAVGTRPIALRLTDGLHQRIIAIEPIVDAPPTVNLIAPAHDSVLRVARGRLSLHADATDDYGITTANFEWIISSGEGESFKFRSGTLGASRTAGKRLTLDATLSLDSLALQPGDIVHIRAVARDANNVSGPGVGSSETRTIRIARADEYDSVAVEAAAPADADKSVVSERMLIMLAEALQQKRSSMKRDAVVGESRSIAVDQKTLRRSVGEIVFTHLGGDPGGEEHTDDSPARARTMQELLARADSATNAQTGATDFAGGESPVVAVNKPLLEAYNAMWDASSELEIGEPGRALPHMRRALAAIQRARQAERLYLRGRPPQVVIDVAKARLQGKDKGAASTRRSLAPVDSASEARTDRFVRIVELMSRSPTAAADSLLLLRIDALADNPAFAAALGDVATAIRRGRSADATNALIRARRALGGAPVVRDSITRWGIVP